MSKNWCAGYDEFEVNCSCVLCPKCNEKQVYRRCARVDGGKKQKRNIILMIQNRQENELDDNNDVTLSENKSDED
ncbi:hypothetical protein RCL_jg710.t1 [Rhizophagus clarus]|uniref:Uncharacterized protein n=1 Tax=Rhizophagus clarus TaxID=94130 RepID=A0A8H3LCE7_9GLOM|nr:hypothetical protein RCL_jg710.t1 [Rhizophagus clarus]